MIVLATLQPLDAAAGTRPVLYVSNTRDRTVAGYNSQVWWPAIARAPTLKIDLFDGDFTGNAGVATGEMTVLMDVLRAADSDSPAYVWAGAPVEIFTWNGSAATSVFSGRVTSFRSQDDKLSLSFVIDVQPFEADVLTAEYAGTGDEEGGEDLAGRPKPWLLGRCFNVEPVLIDAVNNVYQVSAYAAISAVPVLYERGSAFGTSGGNHASYAALVAADIPEGSWGTCLAEGLIRLGAPAYGVITADVDGDSESATWRRKTGAIIEHIADQIGISSALIDTDSLDDLDTAVASNIGVYITNQTSFIELASRLARPCNAVAGVGFDGVFFVSTVGIGTPALTLDAQGRETPPVITVREERVSPPYKRIMLGAKRAWRVHGGDEIAFSAPVVDKGRYDDTKLYVEGNIVDVADGSRWIYINNTPTAGNDPPTWPTTSNTWWDNVSPPSVAGLRTAGVWLFKRSASPPSVPSGDVTYTYATAGVSGTLDGWINSIPSGTDPVYAISYQAVSSDDTVVIGTGDWPSPVVHTLNGTNGTNGANGLNTATVMLFRRTATSTPPSVSTSGSTTYTYSTGGVSGQPTSWTRAVPDASGGAYLWSIEKYVAGTASTATIANNTWPSPILVVQDGDDGSDALSVQAYLTPDRVFVPIDGTDTITSYANATGSFRAFTAAGVDISSSFTLSTATSGNPDGLTVAYNNAVNPRTFTVSAGLTLAEAPGTLVIEATGTGSYAGVVLRRIFTIDVDYDAYLTAMAADFEATNNRNGGTVEAPTLSSVPFSFDPNDNGSSNVDFEWVPASNEDFDGYQWQAYFAPPEEAGGVINLATLGVNPQAMCYGDSGNRMYLGIGANIYQFDLLVPYNPTAAVFVRAQNLSPQATDIRGLFMKPDGTRIYVLNNQATDTVYQFNLSTAWDISTETYPSLFTQVTGFTDPGALWFSTDGVYMFVVGSSGVIKRWTLTVAWAMGSTVTSSTGSLSSATSPVGMCFNATGTKLLIAVGSGSITENSLSTPWAIASGLSLVDTYSTSGVTGNLYDMLPNEAGTKFYPLGSNGICREYTLAAAFDLSSPTAPTIGIGHPGGTAYSWGSDVSREKAGVWPAKADVNKATWLGLAGGTSITARVRSYRRVDPDIDAGGILTSAWVSPPSGAFNPYRPVGVTRYNGFVGRAPAYQLGDLLDIETLDLGADKAVIESIADGTISIEEWAEQGALVTLGTSDIAESNFGPTALELTTLGGRVVMDLIMPFVMNPTDPDHGDIHTFQIAARADDQASATNYYSPGTTSPSRRTVTKEWSLPDAVGGADGPETLLVMQFTFDNIPAGTFRFGYSVTTGSANGLKLPANRYARVREYRTMGTPG